MSAQSIYDISAGLDELALLVDRLEDEGEDPSLIAAVESFFAGMLDRRDEKIDAYCGRIRSWLARAEECKAESKRLADRARAEENKARYLKDRLMLWMESQDMSRIETSKNTVAIQANGGVASLDVDLDYPLEKTPAAFLKTRTDFNLTAIRDYLEGGGELPFAKIMERGKGLRIR